MKSVLFFSIYQCQSSLLPPAGCGYMVSYLSASSTNSFPPPPHRFPKEQSDVLLSFSSAPTVPPHLLRSRRGQWQNRLIFPSIFSLRHRTWQCCRGGGLGLAWQQHACESYPQANLNLAGTDNEAPAWIFQRGCFLGGNNWCQEEHHRIFTAVVTHRI